MRRLGVHHPKKQMIRDQKQFHPPGVLPKKYGGCGLLPKTLTLVKIKICDFPYPSYYLAKN